MNEQTKGNSQLPDFHELNDRIIAEPSTEPKIVIKTNLDPQDITEENPYTHEGDAPSEDFKAFFKGEKQ
jgi:hypothetical protein